MVKTLIRITRGGCGVKYTDGNGVERYALKTPESGAFECEIEQAKRFVGLGMAEYAATPATPAGNPDDGKGSGHLDAEQLEEMTIKQLEALAKEIGADVTGCKKKSDYIAAIVAVEVDLGEEADDDLPDLDAVDPE